MVGSLIKLGGDKGVVIDAGIGMAGELLHKIKWLAPMLGPSADSWVDIKNLHDLKVLVKQDLYGEEQAGL